MKKMLSILLISLIAMGITSCDKTENNDSWKIVSSFVLTEKDKNGMFICNDESNSGQLCFLDFNSMEKSPVCDKPSCNHQNETECSAYGKCNHPFMYNDKLYYFERSDFYQDGEYYYMDSQLWQSDINGSNEKKIAEFKKHEIYDYDRVLIDGNMMYMALSIRPRNKDFEDQEMTMEFISFDLESKETKNYGEIEKGYSAGAWISGKWDNKIIFNTSNSKDNRPYMEKISEFAKKNGLSEEDAFAQYVDEYDNKNCEFDIDKKVLKNNELNEPSAITENCYFYADGETTKYIKNNKINELDIKDVDNINPLGRYCIVTTSNDANDVDTYVFDTQEEKLNKLKSDIGSIEAEWQDNFIIKEIEGDMVTDSCIKKPISELIEQ